jgi:hypothetical protein
VKTIVAFLEYRIRNFISDDHLSVKKFIKKARSDESKIAPNSASERQMTTIFAKNGDEIQMTRFRNSKEANLVVGAVLFIAAMVVASVAVNAWTGNSHQFPQLEEFTVSSFTF